MTKPTDLAPKDKDVHRMSFSDMEISASMLFAIFVYALVDSGDYRFVGALAELERSVVSPNGNPLLDPVASLLAREVERQQQRGFARGYVERIEEATRPRGRTDMPGSIRLKARSSNRLSCIVDTYCDDTYENRVIKKTIALLLRGPNALLVSAHSRDQLARGYTALKDVSDLGRHRVDWSRFSLHRNNSDYRLLRVLCKLAIEGLSVEGLQTMPIERIWKSEVATGETFEAAVRGYYKCHHCELVPPDKHRWVIREDARSENDKSRLPRLHTDVELHGPNIDGCQNITVIETKCYREIFEKGRDGERKLRRSHCNQLFTYVSHRAFRRPKGIVETRVNGVLLYAIGKEEDRAEEELKLLKEPFEWSECDRAMQARAVQLSNLDSFKSTLDAIYERHCEEHIPKQTSRKGA